MPQSATLPTGGGAGGIDSLPTPVKIGLIGGGLGLAFFLWKRATSGGGSQDSSGNLVDSQYGIPNTAVMLGSLQQEMLGLMGQQGADTANLTDLISGGFSNVGSLFDAQTAQFQLGLTDLQNNVIGNQNANTASILASITARGDLLQQLIQSSSGAELAAFQAFADATAHGLNAITAQQNAEQAAIGALGSSISTQQAGIISQITALQQTTAGLVSSQAGITGTLNTMAGQSKLAVGQYFKWWDPQANHWGIGKVDTSGKLQGFSTWSGYLASGGSPDQSAINAYPTVAFTSSYGGTGGQSWAATVL
jgi:hypothetical protein